MAAAAMASRSARAGLTGIGAAAAAACWLLVLAAATPGPAGPTGPPWPGCATGAAGDGVGAGPNGAAGAAGVAAAGPPTDPPPAADAAPTGAALVPDVPPAAPVGVAGGGGVVGCCVAGWAAASGCEVLPAPLCRPWPNCCSPCCRGLFGWPPGCCAPVGWPLGLLVCEALVLLGDPPSPLTGLLLPLLVAAADVPPLPPPRFSPRTVEFVSRRPPTHWPYRRCWLRARLAALRPLVSQWAPLAVDRSRARVLEFGVLGRQAQVLDCWLLGSPLVLLAIDRSRARVLELVV